MWVYIYQRFSLNHTQSLCCSLFSFTSSSSKLLYHLHLTFHPFLSLLCLSSYNKSSFLGRSPQSRIRLSHGQVMRENSDLFSSLLLHLSLFQFHFLGSFLLLYSHSHTYIQPHPDCNNSSNDNNGDVKKHNIKITNTLMSVHLCVCTVSLKLLAVKKIIKKKSDLCVSVCEKTRDWESWREKETEKDSKNEFAGMLYIWSLPLQFKQSRLCWQPPLPSPNGLHHV